MWLWRCVVWRHIHAMTTDKYFKMPIKICFLKLWDTGAHYSPLITFISIIPNYHIVEVWGWSLLNEFWIINLYYIKKWICLKSGWIESNFHHLFSSFFLIVVPRKKLPTSFKPSFKSFTQFYQRAAIAIAANIRRMNFCLWYFSGWVVHRARAERSVN